MGRDARSLELGDRAVAIASTDASFAATLCGVLTCWGYEVVVVDDPNGATDLCQWKRPALIIVDTISASCWDGWISALAAQLRDEAPPTVILVPVRTEHRKVPPRIDVVALEDLMAELPVILSERLYEPGESSGHQRTLPPAPPRPD